MQIMRKQKFKASLALLLGLSSIISCGGGGGGGGGGNNPPSTDFTQTPTAATTQAWMSSEVGAAWQQGYQGKGAKLLTVDDFSSSSFLLGNIDGDRSFKRHGEWVQGISALVAPQAKIESLNYTSRNPIIKKDDDFLIINASYGTFRADTEINEALEQSIINLAKNGEALVVKSAGNDNGQTIDAPIVNGIVDPFLIGLLGTEATIFAGALDSNGTVENPAVIANYSSIPGDNSYLQDHTLMVGVDENAFGGLSGTSFAAPIISGYAAIVQSKFDEASPTQIANQLLETARTDTIEGYDKRIHGRGEASLTRALAPTSIK